MINSMDGMGRFRVSMGRRLLALAILALLSGCKPQAEGLSNSEKIRDAWFFSRPSPVIESVCLGFSIKNPSEYVWPASPQKTRISSRKILRDNRNCMRQSGEEIVKLTYPKAVAADGNGRVYVSDRTGVLLFDESLGEISRFADQSPNDSTVPLGLDVASNGDLYVVDSVRKSVLVYSSQNQYLRTIGEGDFAEPVGAALDETNGWLYVSDKSANTVRKYTLTGTFVSLITSGAAGAPDELAFPLQLAVNSKNELLVLHLGLKIVNVYDKTGLYLFSFGLHGGNPNYYFRPRGIAVDSEDNVYITDFGWEKVQIHSPSGSIRMGFGGAGSMPGRFSLPMMLDIDSNDRIYVVEYGGERVQVFQSHTLKYESGN